MLHDVDMPLSKRHRLHVPGPDSEDTLDVN
jgi:hypothetical protein